MSYNKNEDSKIHEKISMKRLFIFLGLLLAGVLTYKWLMGWIFFLSIILVMGGAASLFFRNTLKKLLSTKNEDIQIRNVEVNELSNSDKATSKLKKLEDDLDSISKHLDS